MVLTWMVCRCAGTTDEESKQKRGYKLPRNIMANADLTRLINSDEVQTIVKPPKVSRMVVPLKKNPLKNLGALLKLNPYAKAARRTELLAQVRRPPAALAPIHRADSVDHWIPPPTASLVSHRQWRSGGAGTVVMEESGACGADSRGCQVKLMRGNGLQLWAGSRCRPQLLLCCLAFPRRGCLWNLAASLAVLTHLCLACAGAQAAGKDDGQGAQGEGAQQGDQGAVQELHQGPHAGLRLPGRGLRSVLCLAGGDRVDACLWLSSRLRHHVCMCCLGLLL